VSASADLLGAGALLVGSSMFRLAVAPVGPRDEEAADISRPCEIAGRVRS
jgi:hypothetical protein